MIVKRTRRHLFLLVAAACVLASASGVAADPPTRSPRAAMEKAVHALVADLFTERARGELISVQATGDLIVRFPVAAPPVDAEYLLVRPAGAADAFARTIGAIRIAEVRGETARARSLWSEDAPRPGDQAIWPPRITIVLLPTDAGELPELGPLAQRLDRWLELELLDRRLRVLRADAPAGERMRAERLRKEREYGLVVAPVLVSAPNGVEFVMRVRSVFTGQTLAQRRGSWSSASASRDSPPPSAPPAPSTSAPPPPAPVSPPTAPYGKAIRPVPRTGEIKVAERSADYAKLALPHVLNAIVVADVDGDRRSEIVGITDQQVIVYRWTGRDLTPIVIGEALPVFTTYLSLDAGDVNGNGKDEIVLTAVRTVPRGNRMENTLESAIVEVKNGRLEPLATNLDRHLRIVREPGQAPVILAQRLGAYDLAEGPVERLEWKDGRYQRASSVPLPRFVPSVHAVARGDLDGDGHAELALVTADDRLLLSDERGHRRWESDEDLGAVDRLGFAQTPRFPDYRGRSFDATAEQLAVWRAIPRRVLFTAAGPSLEVVTVANPRAIGLRVVGRDDGVRGHAVGYGWDREQRTYVKRWESSEVAGPALDLAASDLDGDGRVDLLVLSGTATKRVLEMFTLSAR